MADIQFIIQSIKEKTERIVEKNKQLKSENMAMAGKVSDLERSLNLQRETIKDLEEKNKMLKIANSIGRDKDDKKALKLKINEFIREIDKSMSLLND
jgi:predicted nuclease with TOPRIM domain